MQLNQDQIKQYHEDGLLVIEAAFTPEEVAILCDAYQRDSRIPGPHIITEEGSDEVRGLYGSHLRQPEFTALVRDPRFLGPVTQLLADDVYVYQFKINAKAAFGGDKWAWHQDYLAWKICDNLPSPQQINVGLYLDEVNEFNGPVIFVPGSHRNGLVRDSRNEGDAKSDQHLDPDDIALTPEQMTSLVRLHGMTSPKGPAGTLVFFHTEVVHGSAQNMSPFPRKLLLATYNDVTNQARPAGEPRPEYVVCRDTRPLSLLDASLLAVGAGGSR
ncbi:MAG TPA: phytanoyl-CoA dioxygenase family protein [Chthonomonadaceae bacterium]|nr:phytanoyl-CoA dioxygenase family protein [Chthonomonadaceae bacterium]